MLPIPLLAEGPFNWTGLILTLVALAVGWTILRFVLRLTLKIFALGCTGLLIVVGVLFVLLYNQ
ncbi:MAG TPA: hypothetical protein VI793_16240 [Anaerolineales bacterium]|nr:hypothetical protein [Anaerolineales bacterium]